MPGLDRTIINQINFDKAINRISADLKTDFMFAPHFDFIYKHASDELIGLLQKKLSDGTFQFSLPVILNVPKPSKLSRPGSIQEPLDRLTYQVLADLIAPAIESGVDRTHVFSHVYKDSNDNMFKDQGECYKNFQLAIGENLRKYNFCLKTDIASYFETINQHVLINLLTSLGVDTATVRFLEEALLAWREKNSHGIIQGVFGSDLLGNYYLTHLDYFLEIRSFQYCRFLDDIYVFHNNLNELTKLLVEICDKLRKQGLFLNESKTKLKESHEILREETEFDRLFDEINDMLNGVLEEDSEVFSVDYGFQVELDEEAVNEEDYTEIEGFRLDLIKELYSRKEEAKWQRDNIVRFCLPLFAKAHSDYPLDGIKDEITNYAHLAKHYCSYLATIERNNNVITQTIENTILSNELVYDYQLLWLFSSLLYRAGVSNKLLDRAVQVFENRQIHETIRAICAILISKVGSGIQKRTLRDEYQNEPSVFVRSAILFGTRYISSEERTACRGAWGGHSELNSLIIKAQKNYRGST